MDKDLKKELLKYTSAAAAMLTGVAAQGQYQYTNINDTTINTNGGFYDLDLDQDGSTDFRITQYVDTGLTGKTNAILIQPYTNTTNVIAGKKAGQYNYPFKLEASTLIDENTGWNGAGGANDNGYMAFVVDGQSYPNSNWVGPIEDGYLGLVIFKGAAAHLGWARLDIGENSEEFTVKDFSVNLTADSSMIVGYSILGEMENLLSGVSFKAEDDLIIFSNSKGIENLNIKLFDLTGRELRSVKMIEPKLELNIADLSSAVYIIEIESKGLTRREKVFIY